MILWITAGRLIHSLFFRTSHLRDVSERPLWMIYPQPCAQSIHSPRLARTAPPACLWICGQVIPRLKTALAARTAPCQCTHRHEAPEQHQAPINPPAGGMPSASAAWHGFCFVCYLTFFVTRLPNLLILKAFSPDTIVLQPDVFCHLTLAGAA